MLNLQKNFKYIWLKNFDCFLFLNINRYFFLLNYASLLYSTSFFLNINLQNIFLFFKQIWRKNKFKNKKFKFYQNYVAVNNFCNIFLIYQLIKKNCLINFYSYSFRLLICRAEINNTNHCGLINVVSALNAFLIFFKKEILIYWLFFWKFFFLTRIFCMFVFTCFFKNLLFFKRINHFWNLSYNYYKCVNIRKNFFCSLINYNFFLI